MTEYIVKFETNSPILARVIESRSAQLRGEIVRCRDCKWFDTHTEPNLCYRLDNGEPVEPDGFCAWGEREVDA